MLRFRSIFSSVLTLSIVAASCGVSAAPKADVLNTETPDLETFQGLPNDPINLKSSEGQELIVTSRDVYEGRPDGFYRRWIKGLTITFTNTESHDDFQVVLTARCTNYNNVSYTAYVACGSQFEAESMKSVTTLSKENCSSNEREEHTRFHFFNYGNIYLSGRTGYYQSQSCRLDLAVQKNGSWLVNPVGQGNDFSLGAMSAIPYREEADILRVR